MIGKLQVCCVKTSVAYGAGKNDSPSPSAPLPCNYCTFQPEGVEGAGVGEHPESGEGVTAQFDWWRGVTRDSRAGSG